MASNIETATSKVILDGKEAEDELKRLTKLSADLKKQLRLAVQSGDDTGAKKLRKELSDVEKSAAAAKKEMNSISTVMKNLNGSSLKQLQQAQRQLTAEIRSSTRYTREEIAAIEAKKKQLLLLKTEIDKVQSSMALQKGGFMGNMANGFNKYFTMATSFVMAISGVALSLTSLVKGNAELSDSFADVAKTAGLTIPEVKDLYKELGKIDTRTSRKDLLDLAYAAGKLGFTGKSEIVGFVKAADQIGVALSKDLGGNVEEAVTSVGKLVDIFKIKDKFGIEQALLNTGSAINALGASGTATESYIVEFTKRLGGIAPQANISIEKVMGLGATLDQLGQQVETSSTAVSQLITKMFQKPGEYAKIAGVNVAEFTKLLKTDANAALIKLLEGLNKNKGGLTELATKFGDLGVDGSRAISVIGALSNNVQMLKDAQHLSNIEFAKGTSLTNEFNLKNDNMAGNLERVGKALRGAFINSSIMSGLEKLVKWMASWGDIPLAEKLEQERIKVNVLAAQLMEANVQATTRNKLYGELKALAPDVVKGINQEAIAYNLLRINLEKYNQQMINKIVLARKDAEIENMANDAADWVAKRTKAEQGIRDYMTRSADFVAKRNKEAGDQLKFIVNNELLTFQQKYSLFWQSITQLQKANTGGSQIIALDKDKISSSYTMYLGYLDKEKAAVGQVNGVSNERNELAKSLGVSLGIVNQEVQQTGDLTKQQSEDEKKDNEEKKKGVKELKDAFQKLDEQISELDGKIKNAIGAGDVPLAKKLSLEQQAAEDLLAVYKELKLQIDKGWSLPGLEMGPQPEEIVNGVESLISKTARNVKAKKPSKNPLTKRDTNLSGDPGDQAAATEKEDQQRRDDWRNAEYDMAATINTTVFNMVRNRQQAELDHKLNILDQQREAELKNENLTAKQKDAINAKYDAKIRKEKQAAWKKQRNADAISTTIATILAVMKAGGPLNPVGALTALAGAASVVEILSAKVPEFAAGRYNVTGANTGKQYDNVPYTGPAVTGLYTRPALVAENGGEMIIDSRTTRNLMMNFPGIIDAINSAKNNQYDAGRFIKSVPNTANSRINDNSEYNTMIKGVLNLLKKIDTEGIKAKTVLSLFDLEKKQAQKASIQSSTEM